MNEFTIYKKSDQRGNRELFLRSNVSTSMNQFMFDTSIDKFHQFD